MALPASGSIKLSDVNTELGLTSTAAITLGTAGVRTLFGIGSGGIKLSDGYGKANEFNLTISTNASDINVATAATAAGWNGSIKLVVTIDSGVYVSSTSTGNAALTVTGTFAGGVELVNNGYIAGIGGTGGGSHTAGSAGGLALSVSSAISITNNGTIAGGGGGGGGGGRVYLSGFGSYIQAGGGGGGGGRSGASNSSGGAYGSAYGNLSGNYYQGTNGSAGSSSAAGSGGNRSYATNLNAAGGEFYGGNGGVGGDWGTSGSSGSGASWNGAAFNPAYVYYNGGGSGGSAGGAVSGNSNITWVATGTRLGSIA